MTHPSLHWPALGAWLLTAACAPPAGEPAPQQAREEPAPRVRASERGAVSSIRLEEFFLLHQSGQALVIDTRPAAFHHAGRIPGAVSLPRRQSPQAVSAMENDIKQAVADGRTIVAYCSGMWCADARTVARHISSLGYPASIFSGGWDAWTDADLPVEANGSSAYIGSFQPG